MRSEQAKTMARKIVGSAGEGLTVSVDLKDLEDLCERFMLVKRREAKFAAHIIRQSDALGGLLYTNGDAYAVARARATLNAKPAASLAWHDSELLNRWAADLEQRSEYERDCRPNAARGLGAAAILLRHEAKELRLQAERGEL